MTPKLTPEQREQVKLAHRANTRINETWSLYNLYLSEGDKPALALEKAHEAVAVWSEWMGQYEIEPPEIEQPDFMESVKTASREIMREMAEEKKAIKAESRVAESQEKP